MPDVTLVNPGTIDAWSYTEGQMKFTEQMHWVLLKQWESLYSAGFQLSFVSSSEATTILSGIDTFHSNIFTWIQGVLGTAGVEDGETRDLPVLLEAIVPALISLLPAGWVAKIAAYLPLIYKIIELVLKIWSAKKEYDSDTDLSDVMEILDKALLFENTEGERMSILQMLANQDIRVILQSGVGLDDIVIEDSQ